MNTVDSHSQTETPEWFPFRPQKPVGHEVLRGVMALGLVLLPLMMALWLILSIVFPSDRSPIPVVALTAICYTWLFVLGLSQGIVTFSDIVLENEGIRLKLPGSWSRLVPWQALREMTIKPVGAFLPYKPAVAILFWGRKASTIYAVHVPGLTVLHLFTGLYYGMGFRPVFVITQDHERYDVLLERLKQAAIQQGCDPARLE